MSPLRAAVLFHRIGPYHFARLRAASSVFHLAAIEYLKEDSTYAWDEVSGSNGFTRVTLDCGLGSLPARQIACAMHDALSRVRPQVVAIPGWSDGASLAALNWCQRHRIPAIVMSETTAWDGPRQLHREWVKRQLVSGFQAGLVGGNLHRKYLATLGVPPENAFLGYDAVDNHYFAERTKDARTRSSEIRSSYGLPQQYFLASARFVEAKNLNRLLKAYHHYRQLANNESVWDLVLLGDGPLRDSLCSLRSTLGLEPHVLMPGFKQYHDLPAYYGLASAFVHASSTEPWGLVVNEAMAASLPVLVSNRCGCAYDLVQEGRNGFTFDAYDVELLARLMYRLSLMPKHQLDQLGTNSSEAIKKWGLGLFEEGLSHAVQKAMEVGPRQGSWLRILLLEALVWC
jgi:1,2-diacylglycerol 3-alpha-glucosyltransferase